MSCVKVGPFRVTIQYFETFPNRKHNTLNLLTVPQNQSNGFAAILFSGTLL